MNDNIGQPFLVLLRRPPTLPHQHAVHIPPSKHPEDIPGGLLIQSSSKHFRVAQRNDHSLLPLIAQALSLLFQFYQFGRDDPGTSQQIERGSQRLMDSPGHAGREPQTGFGIARAHRLAYGVLVPLSKSGLIEKFPENSRLRLEKGIYALRGHPRPLRDRFDSHSIITLAQQELPRGADDTAASITRLTLAER